MALIKCPQCGKPISGKALQCPHCGARFGGEQPNEPNKLMKIILSLLPLAAACVCFWLLLS